MNHKDTNRNNVIRNEVRKSTPKKVLLAYLDIWNEHNEHMGGIEPDYQEIANHLHKFRMIPDKEVKIRMKEALNE